MPVTQSMRPETTAGDRLRALENFVKRRRSMKCAEVPLSYDAECTQRSLRLMFLRAFRSGIIVPDGAYACIGGGIYMHLSKCGRLVVMLPLQGLPQMSNSKEPLVGKFAEELSRIFEVFAEHGVNLGFRSEDARLT